MNIIFTGLAFIGVLLPLLAPRNNRRRARRIFWSGVLIATTSAFFITYPDNWKTGLSLSLLFGGVMVFRAYTGTTYIKIRGKIYAYSAIDRQPDPPTGATTSGK